MRENKTYVDVKLDPSYGINRTYIHTNIGGADKLSVFVGTYIQMTVEEFLSISDSERKMLMTKNPIEKPVEKVKIAAVTEIKNVEEKLLKINKKQGKKKNDNKSKTKTE